MKKDILEFTLYTVEHRNNCVQVIDKYQYYAQAKTPLVVIIKPKKNNAQSTAKCLTSCSFN